MTNTNEWEALKAKVQERTSDPLCDNGTRRTLHAEVELFILDMEENGDKDATSSSLSDYQSTLKQLNLVPVARNTAWWYWIDVIFRFVGVVAGIITLGLILPIPIIFLRAIDQVLVTLKILSPFTLLSGVATRFLSRFLLMLSGIEIELSSEEKTSTTVDEGYFSESCVILTFTHSSNLDGFLVSGTCPIQHYAIAKKELFIVPMFSWLAFAIGGVPVDRKNRERAVNALKAAANSAQSSKSCLVIAPEGTRSTTGQLLPFKKGVFHQWESLQVPMVPFVSYGGYDLYPVGSWVNQCGKIYVRYLKPIMPHEAKTRDEMHNILKRRMLISMMDTPKDVAGEISWFGRITNIVSILGVLNFDYFAIKYLHQLLYIDLEYKTWEIVLYGTLGAWVITFTLYIYFVYIVDMLRPRSPVSPDKKKE